MRHCILFYEHVNRDYATCLRIKYFIEECSNHGISVILYSITYEWPDAVRYARTHIVELVIFPWMRWSPHFEYAQLLYRCNNNVRFLILNQEQAGSPCSTNLLMPQNSFAREGVYHCSWTQMYADELVDAGVLREHIRVTGNAKLDTVDAFDSHRSEFADAYGLDANKKWILFAESRNIAVLKSDYFKERQRYCGIAESDIEEQISYFERSLREFERQLSELSSVFFAEYELIYRLHPGQENLISIPSRVHEITEGPIGEWIASCDVYMTFSSTSAFEAEQAHVPVLIHNPIPVEQRYQMRGIGAFRSVQHIQEIMTIDFDKLRLEQASRSVGSGVVGVPNSDAALAVAEWACVLACCPEFELPQKPPREMNKILMRDMYLKTRASRLVIRLGLFERLKWPHIAYRNKADLPPEWIAEKPIGDIGGFLGKRNL